MEPVTNNIAEAIGWSILHSLWRGTIIYFLLFLSQLALPKMSAILKHNLAAGSLVLMFFCLCYLSIYIGNDLSEPGNREYGN